MFSFNLLASLLLVGCSFWHGCSLPAPIPPRFLGYDCSHIWERNTRSVSGIYTIKPVGAKEPFTVFCEMSSAGGCTVIQKHNGESGLSFDKSWQEYKKGFGKRATEQWLGLDKIYLLTNQYCRPAKLNITLCAFSGDQAHAYYDSFKVGSETLFYKLSLGNYSGTAGDAFRGYDDDTNVDGSFFSTNDQDNDQCDPCFWGDMAYNSCGEDYRSGWWFNKCATSNLNGNWHPAENAFHWRSAVSWETWRQESLKSAGWMLVGHQFYDHFANFQRYSW